MGMTRFWFHHQLNTRMEGKDGINPARATISANQTHPYRSPFFGKVMRPKKYRLARWDIICRPKEQGGLGIKNLEVKNRCLLSKWLYRLSAETEGMWVQIL